MNKSKMNNAIKVLNIVLWVVLIVFIVVISAEPRPSDFEHEMRPASTTYEVVGSILFFAFCGLLVWTSSRKS